VDIRKDMGFVLIYEYLVKKVVYKSILSPAPVPVNTLNMQEYSARQ